MINKMKKILVIICLCFFGCTQKLIDNNNTITKIVIIENSTNKILKTETDLSEIKKIIEQINLAEKNPVKFYPMHRVEIYKDNSDKQEILVNGFNIKIEGVTYSLKKDVIDSFTK